MNSKPLTLRIDEGVVNWVRWDHMPRRLKDRQTCTEPVFDENFGRKVKGKLDLRLNDEDRLGARRAGITRKNAPREARDNAGRNQNPRRQRAQLPFAGGLIGAVCKGLYWSTVLGLWALIGMIGVMVYFTTQLPSSTHWAIPDRPPNVKIVAVDGSLLANRGMMGGEDIPLHEMSAYMPQAIIAIEDRRFYRHFGFDIIGFARAMATNIAQGRVVQGGSSLTQQLAKNLFLSPERSLERKVQELVLALWLEAKFSKDQIVEMYLNRVYFGANTYGVDAAARRYFKKSARNLTLGEAATLAGLVKAPSKLAPSKNPQGAKKRAQRVLAAMEREGYISARERAIALSMSSPTPPPRQTGAEHYIGDWVISVLPEYVDEITQDLIVDTTIDRHLQSFAQKAINNGLEEHGERLGVSQSSLVAMDGIGAVRAMIGGRDYGQSQFNRAIKAKRQPGSSFKPFVYLAAMESGLTPDSIRLDAPFSIKGWQPRNYSKEYEGNVKLRTALVKSLNIIAAKLGHEVGPQMVVDVAKRLGIRSPLKANHSLALGTSEVTPFELATAYVPFANGGYKVSPFIIKRVMTKDGKVLYQRSGNEPFANVIKAKHLGMMNSMLSETIVHGTGKRAALKNWPAGGKTGTSQDFRDAWFAGFTANLTTVVWVGNDDNTPTKRASGGNLPATIWKQFMEEAHQGIPVSDLPGRYEDQMPADYPPPHNSNAPIVRNNVRNEPEIVRATETGTRIRSLLSKIFGTDG